MYACRLTNSKEDSSGSMLTLRLINKTAELYDNGNTREKGDRGIFVKIVNQTSYEAEKGYGKFYKGKSFNFFLLPDEAAGLIKVIEKSLSMSPEHAFMHSGGKTFLRLAKNEEGKYVLYTGSHEENTEFQYEFKWNELKFFHLYLENAFAHFFDSWYAEDKKSSSLFRKKRATDGKSVSIRNPSNGAKNLETSPDEEEREMVESFEDAVLSSSAAEEEQTLEVD